MERVNWERVRDVLISILCVGVMLWATWSLLGLFVHAIVLLLLAMAVAFLVTPLVDLLNRYLPRILAALLVYALVLAILGGLCYALVFSLIQQVNYFSQNLPGYVQDLPTTYANTQKWLIQQGIPQQTIDATINSINQQANAFAASLANNLVSIIFVVTDAIINVLVVVVVSFYLVLDGKRIRTSIIGIVPKPSTKHVLLFEDALNRVVGNYIRGQLTLAAIIGILAGAGCYMLGLKNFALIIGVLAFLFETIPMVGPALASIPAILISLLLPEPFPRSYEILIYFVIVQIFESNILGPRIVGHAVGLHPIASILALIVGAQLFGAFGALLATPIVAAFWVVIVSLYRSIRGEPADVMLARRRSSWIRRRPHDIHTRTNTGRGHLNSIPGNNSMAEHIQEVPLQIKGLATPGKIEHLDLLRHVHTQEQPASEQEDSIE
ncbi:MAG TPA: AI-2E family transporter [Ktedonobacteraceae bacterium]|nr:AI-2E family transporter [Ktedonobacteraceae bacterium]